MIIFCLFFLFFLFYLPPANSLLPGHAREIAQKTEQRERDSKKNTETFTPKKTGNLVRPSVVIIITYFQPFSHFIPLHAPNLTRAMQSARYKVLT